MAISTDLRKAVEEEIASSRETRYSLAKAAGIDYYSFTRWLDENRDIRASTIDALAEYLCLELTRCSGNNQSSAVATAKPKKTVKGRSRQK